MRYTSFRSLQDDLGTGSKDFTNVGPVVWGFGQLFEENEVELAIGAKLDH